ncbi:hypothetical protein ElyMa_005793400, partial [Elysia marginata]
MPELVSTDELQFVLQAHAFPPTPASATDHSLRVYPQVQQWIRNNQFWPEKW